MPFLMGFYAPFSDAKLQKMPILSPKNDFFFRFWPFSPLFGGGYPPTPLRAPFLGGPPEAPGKSSPKRPQNLYLIRLKSTPPIFSKNPPPGGVKTPKNHEKGLKRAQKGKKPRGAKKPPWPIRKKFPKIEKTAFQWGIRAKWVFSVSLSKLTQKRP